MCFSGAMVEFGVVFVGVFLAAFALTAWTRRVALRRGILDRPNERSSHSQPTPRGGGLAIVISSSIAIGGLAVLHRVDNALAAALLGGGLLIATVGFIDDQRSLTAGIRIVAHVGAAAWAMYMLGGVPVFRIGAHVISLGLWGDLLGIVAIVWVLNLFNFMDGIDGIAASEAVFLTGAGAAIAIVYQQDFAVAYSAFSICAAALGFLCWNWPPAKIFMGDVGSGYLGFTIAVAGFAAGRTSTVAPFAWLILGGVFFADATTTLLVRAVRREQIHLPHRDHVYQRLAARWRAHRPVTLLVCAINLLGLGPVALLALVHQELAAAIAASTLLCLSAMFLLLRKLR
jgi:Fuc2NAc and GlcNAc transferase